MTGFFSGVSVIIPAYNAATTIARAVQSALTQKDVETEILVVNDASIDDTPSIVRGIADSRVQIVSLPKNVGGSAARNVGIAKASYPLLAFLDADDAWLPTKLTKQIDTLQNASSGTVGVYCDGLDECGSVAGAKDVDDLQVALLCRETDTFAGSGLMILKRTANQIGGFQSKYRRLQDVEFMIRLLDIGQITHLKEPLFERNFYRPLASADQVEAASHLFLTDFSHRLAALDPCRAEAGRARLYAQIALHYLVEGKQRKASQYLGTACQHDTITTGQFVMAAAGRRLRRKIMRSRRRSRQPLNTDHTGLHEASWHGTETWPRPQRRD